MRRLSIVSPMSNFECGPGPLRETVFRPETARRSVDACSGFGEPESWPGAPDYGNINGLIGRSHVQYRVL